jgi:hypothetical protein
MSRSVQSHFVFVPSPLSDVQNPTIKHVKHFLLFYVQVLERVGLSVHSLLLNGGTPEAAAALCAWGEAALHKLVATFLAARFPILLALNKVRGLPFVFVPVFCLAVLWSTFNALSPTFFQMFCGRPSAFFLPHSLRVSAAFCMSPMMQQIDLFLVVHPSHILLVLNTHAIFGGSAQACSLGGS